MSAFAPAPPLYRADTLRALESAHADLALMTRAGAAAAEWAQQLATGGRVLILAGPGNNGGDAFVIAELIFSTAILMAVVEGRLDEETLFLQRLELGVADEEVIDAVFFVRAGIPTGGGDDKVKWQVP